MDTFARLSVFLLILTLMLGWEQLAPQRDPTHWRRRLHNLTLVICSTALLRALPGLSAATAATYAAQHHIGLLQPLNPWLAGLLSCIALDLLIYTQHIALHRIPFLWPLHRVHHSDTELDTTTGIRFHPLEILLSMALKSAAVLALGAPLSAVITFEIILNASSLFNHGNVRIPPAIDRILRRCIVTPAMHRVHHSTRDHNRNFGFNLSIWDRLFGTYQTAPTVPTIGLQTHRAPSNSLQLLAQPFVKYNAPP